MLQAGAVLSENVLAIGRPKILPHVTGRTLLPSASTLHRHGATINDALDHRCRRFLGKGCDGFDGGNRDRRLKVTVPETTRTGSTLGAGAHDGLLRMSSKSKGLSTYATRDSSGS